MSPQSVAVLFFGSLRNYVPEGRVLLSLDPRMTAREVRHLIAEELKRQVPAFPRESRLEGVAVATEGQVLGDNDAIGTSRELALLPPVCGGVR